MMGPDRREEYFIWLCHRVKTPENADYSKVLRLMFEKEFIWVVGNDDNRVQDGRELKRIFLSNKYGVPECAHDEPVSVLEVLVALSDRLSFLIDIDSPECAWMLIQNLKLDKYRTTGEINDILDKLIWRTYRRNGVGGFFPLKRSTRDQTTVEIWYQMTEWIEEHFNPDDI